MPILKNKMESILNRGSYLSERIPTSNSSDDSVKRWMERTGMDWNILEHRLKEDNLNSENFSGLLSQTEEMKLYNENPHWYTTLKSILTLEDEFSLIEDIDQEEVNRLFIPLSHPFLSWVKMKMTAFINNSDTSKIKIDAESIISAIIKSTQSALILISCKTLIKELHTHRENEQLVGMTPEDRFDDFIERFITRSEDITNLFITYPVLGRLMAQKVNQVIDIYCEAISRFISDYSIIKSRFSLEGTLLSIQADIGDTHENGRSVMIFHFQTGKLVYKPRNLSADLHFQNLIRWINQKGFSLPLKALETINQENYGWIEFVSHDPCSKKEELSNFYYRQGANLAILYVLGASDFHLENIIASGEHPILIDLEGILQNSLDLHKGTDATAMAVKELNTSVFRSAMLPINYIPNQNKTDVSALGSHGNQQLEQETLSFIDIGTDQMRLQKVRAHTAFKENLPIFNGKQINALDFIQDLSEGFTELYKLFLANKHILLAEEGPLVQFKNDRVRVILRDTQTYASFLDASNHPSNLSDGLKRVQHFDFLWRMAGNFSEYESIVASECKDLLQQDIPIFFTEVDSCAIYDSSMKPLNLSFESSSYDYLIEKVNSLSSQDLKKQIYYIRMSLSTLSKKNTLAQVGFNTNENNKVEKVDGTIFLNTAKKIGDHLYESAIFGQSKNDVTWVGVNSDFDETLSVSPLELGLYNGISGIGLFFSALAKITKEERYKRIVDACVQRIRNTINTDVANQSLSAFFGRASIAYSLGLIGSTWEDESLLQESKNHLKSGAAHIESDDIYDLMGGTAGFLIVTVNLYKITKDPDLLDIAIKCGNHLIKHMILTASEVGWGFNRTSKILTGLSHGNTGIAWALTSLYSVTGEQSYRQAALQAIKHENTLFDKDEQNWLDLRFDQGDKDKLNPVNWCHGASGIGIGRVNIYKDLPDPSVLEDINLAVNTTIKRGFGDNHSLCHGDFGNLELLLLADPYLKRNHVSLADDIAYKIIKNQDSQWLSGVPGKFETPGFMLGLSGVGYSLLRLFDKELPSILNLELIGKSELR